MTGNIVYAKGTTLSFADNGASSDTIVAADSTFIASGFLEGIVTGKRFPVTILQQFQVRKWLETVTADDNALSVSSPQQPKQPLFPNRMSQSNLDADAIARGVLDAKDVARTWGR